MGFDVNDLDLFFLARGLYEGKLKDRHFIVAISLLTEKEDNYH